MKLLPEYKEEIMAQGYSSADALRHNQVGIVTTKPQSVIHMLL